MSYELSRQLMLGSEENILNAKDNHEFIFLADHGVRSLLSLQV